MNSDARTDIIIPVYGSPDHLKRCTEALRLTVASDAANIFIVDDATPFVKGAAELDELYEALPTHFRVEKLSQNRGYAGANNYGVALGSSEYVCLLNSDTQPQAHWLPEMESILDANPDVSLVGAKLVFPLWVKDDPFRPAGKIQHAGVAFNADRMPYHIFTGWNPKHPMVNRPLKMNAVTGACWLLRREVFEQIGGLDTAYKQGNFEDIDFCLKVGELGHSIAYAPKALLWHYASGSDNTAHINANALLFRSRWFDKIEYDDFLYW